MSWFVIGISGVTCGGKTTLATRFIEYLSDSEHQKTLKSVHNIQINQVRIIHQDRYFWPRDSPKHVWIDELQFINRELLSAIDTDAINRDIDAILCENVKNTVTTSATLSAIPSNETSTAVVINGNEQQDQQEPQPPHTSPIQLNILVIEGFLIFNDQRIDTRCDLKFFFHLSFETCWQRRRKRVFKHVNPHPEQYFKEILWPSYKKHLNEICDPKNIIYLNGELELDDIFKLSVRYFIERVSLTIDN